MKAKSNDLFLIFLIFLVAQLLVFLYAVKASNSPVLTIGQVWLYTPSDQDQAKLFKLKPRNYYKISSLQNDIVGFYDLQDSTFSSSSKAWFLLDSKLVDEQ